MVSSIGASGINPVQMFNAVNAFKSAEKVNEAVIQDTSAGININDTNILQNQNLEEIKNIAEIAGESSLSNDDIQYGLTYGRSVIADYIV